MLELQAHLVLKFGLKSSSGDARVSVNRILHMCGLQQIALAAGDYEYRDTSVLPVGIKVRLRHHSVNHCVSFPYGSDVTYGSVTVVLGCRDFIILWTFPLVF